jgi:hypothetical protein
MPPKPAKKEEPPPPPPEPEPEPLPKVDPDVERLRKEKLAHQQAGGFDARDSIFGFIFPPKERHPRSGARLFVYGRYGPLHNGGIAGGMKRTHILSESELRSLLEDEERDFVNEVYRRKDSAAQPVDVGHVHPDVHKALQYTKEEVELLLVGAGDNFHRLQQLIVEDRKRRIREFQRTVIRFDLVKEQNDDAYAKTFGRDNKLQTWRSTMRRSYIDPNDESYNALSKLLAKSAKDVVQIGENSAEVSRNVRLIRTDDPDKFVGKDIWRKY